MYTDIPSKLEDCINNGFASVAAFNKVFKETYQKHHHISKEKERNSRQSGKYVGELYIAIRMKMIKSLMYDINKKFHISYMGIFNVYYLR